MKISVALCTYNGSKYLKKQIDSILNQQGNILHEIVVCDDKSTDDTLKILTEYKILHPTIFEIHINEKNIGSTKNFEKAISICSGDYIFLSDQDDIWKNNKIQKILAVFNKNPNAEGVFSNADLIDKDNNPIKTLTIWDSVFFLEKELPKPIDFFNVTSKNGNVVTGATLCIKKSIKSFIFPFADDDILHDEKIADILALRKSLYYSIENLISYRIHDKQQVGMKNINRSVKKNRLKRIILDLEAPSTFNEHRYLSKKIYLKLKKSKKLQHHLVLNKDSQNLITKCNQEFDEINIQMESKFLLRYKIVKLIDNLLRKREI
ncbi:glycosyltransferase [Flavobacterium cellulosilyticum]|uniref:Glycosyltransferase n=1 Tax=Flavobacterium cellulosilyticum TaxID=2541731 RepID=A0A4R5CJU9_9FLAO|nr:glycosyltransferase [Flavobacterium cellulosilyticum]TDD98633.1 glycosyltransferase [Flavobacterium cellulosilyticum]